MFQFAKRHLAAISISIAMVLVGTVVPACSAINKGAAGLGLGVEYADVFSEASTIEDQIYLSVGLYQATLVAVDSQCVGSASNDILFAACDKASEAADKLEPAIDALLASTGVYVKSKADMQAAIAAGGVASPEMVMAVSTTAANLALEYSRIREDIAAFVSKPGN